jgi:pilus assembly protein CpaC
MTINAKLKGVRLALAIATTLAVGTMPANVSAAPAKKSGVSIKRGVSSPVFERATGNISLSRGRGQLITLPEAISDILIADPSVVDVQVRSPRQIYIFGQGPGATSFFVLNSAGKVMYSTNVQVQKNINSLDQMLELAMPDSDIATTTMNGMVLLTGSVASPEERAEAEGLVKAYLGDGIQVVSRLKTATPMQVTLQVKIAEVSREFAKEISLNLNGNNGSSLGGGSAFNFSQIGGSGTLNLAGRFLGLNLDSALELAERDGLFTTLAQPNITAVSGQSASFLAGGEIGFPVGGGVGVAPSVQFKPYGVSVNFTPIVHSDGRISLKVSPEVSQITSAGSVQGIPAIQTRRVDTTVELGSGQSFMIGGLLRNEQNNSMDKIPGLGNLPIIGALFRSNNFRRSETELMIIVTPYLVKPVSANQIALPTDGYITPTDAERVLGGELFIGQTGAQRPKPSYGQPTTVPQPGMSGGADARDRKSSRRSDSDTSAAPGFGN